MKFLRRIFLLSPLLIMHLAMSQDSTGLAGTPYTESADGTQYLFKKWYTGSVRTSDDRVHDGLKIRYDVTKDELEYRTDSTSGMYRVSAGIKEFNLPTGTDLYTFKNGYPAVADYSEKNFYRLLYDGNTKLLKKYVKPINVEKASATTNMDPSAKLYVLKDGKMNPVQLKNRNSFLKLLTDERNKMQYVIREQQLDFAGDDDLVKLLEEYDSYKAGRGGN
jgi:hypothetical protein